MNDITVDILLEFLYNEFAVTFVFCFIGSWIRETLRSKKKDESSILNIKRIVTSTVFSTFLMCACAKYIDLPFEVYAAISVLCGIWGIIMVNIAASGNFMLKFLSNIIKSVTNPILKTAVKTATEYLDEQESLDKDEKKDSKDKKE